MEFVDERDFCFQYESNNDVMWYFWLNVYAVQGYWGTGVLASQKSHFIKYENFLR